jgi:hypothetical protein
VLRQDRGGPLACPPPACSSRKLSTSRHPAEAPRSRQASSHGDQDTHTTAIVVALKYGCLLQGPNTAIVRRPPCQWKSGHTLRPTSLKQRLRRPRYAPSKLLPFSRQAHGSQDGRGHGCIVGADRTAPCATETRTRLAHRRAARNPHQPQARPRGLLCAACADRPGEHAGAEHAEERGC